MCARVKDIVHRKNILCRDLWLNYPQDSGNISFPFKMYKTLLNHFWMMPSVGIKKYKPISKYKIIQWNVAILCHSWSYIYKYMYKNAITWICQNLITEPELYWTPKKCCGIHQMPWAFRSVPLTRTVFPAPRTPSRLGVQESLFRELRLPILFTHECFQWDRVI